MQIRILAALLVILAHNRAVRADSTAAALTTVPHLDLNRYVGEWHEIARYPNRFERHCVRNIKANYATRPDGKISVVNSCVTPAGKTKKTTGFAKVIDKTTNAKLRVTFLWPFYGNYWVIDLDPEYEWVVVGEPTRKYLWILSRSPALDAKTYAKIAANLQTLGYDPERLSRARGRGER